MTNANGGCRLADFVSTLPALEHQGILPSHLREYQGTWLPEAYVAGTVNIQNHFQPQSTDIVVTSYPKCGTTWLKALVFASMTRTQHSFASHPLHRLNPRQCMPFLEMEACDAKRLSDINAMAVPRLLSTHLPFQMLPDSIKSSGCRIVYICREPKDAFLSSWHFFSRMNVSSTSDEKVSLNMFLEMCCDGLCPYGTIWDHVLGYWNESLRAPERILLLKYEEMLEAPKENLLRIAEFIGCPFNEKEATERVHEEIVKLCRFNSLKTVAIEQNCPISSEEEVTWEIFYRKGVAGDWRNSINSDMAQRIDQITNDKLLKTGLDLGRPGLPTPLQPDA